ncbi:MAG: ABC transporter ATP-binding protein [Christensenellales bacterium]
MLELKGINTYYDNSHILHDVSLTIPEGRAVALLGRNGVGKTTTLRSIMGLTPPRDGQILYDGKEIQKLSAYQVAQLGIGYVPQGRRLFKSLTTKEHLEVFEKKGEWTVERTLDYFPRLKERLTSKGNELSGGEQQMLAIGRALMTNPKLLVMDEPTEGLAPFVVREVGNLVESLKQEGLTILLTEQKMYFALDIVDEVYVMSKGEIVFHGLPDELLGNEYVKSTYLGV